MPIKCNKHKEWKQIRQIWSPKHIDCDEKTDHQYIMERYITKKYIKQ